MRHYAVRKQEHFLCASINGTNEILAIRVVSVGLIDRAPVHPREVFAEAQADRASGIIVAHNHPAGRLEPSAADIEATRQFKAAGVVLGIPLLDHIIFNRAGYFSFCRRYGCEWALETAGGNSGHGWREERRFSAWAVPLPGHPPEIEPQRRPSRAMPNFGA